MIMMNKHLFSSLDKKNKAVCWHCKKSIQEGQYYIGSKTGRESSKRYCIKCAKLINIVIEVEH